MTVRTAGTRATGASGDLLTGLLLGSAFATGLIALGWFFGRHSVPTAERDPVLDAFLNAPVDKEPLTPEEATLIAEGRAERKRGDVVPWTEVRRAGQISA